jgi:hypothetical protein
MSSGNTVTLPSELGQVKTMLSTEELALLYTLARDTYTGRGEIVDGGAFLGGSTLALGCGLRDNRRVADKAGRIYSYDMFVPEQYSAHHLASFPPGTTNRQCYDATIAPIASYVRTFEGDIKTFPWDPARPIEILFIDVAKSWDINDFLLHQFFPRLIPGVSHVIQQDYHWPHVPWLSVTMELLSDYFTYLGSMPWATAHYRCERAIEPGVLPRRLMDLGNDKLRELAERAQRFDRGGREWTAQQFNLVCLHWSLGDLATASSVYDETIAAADPKWVEYFHFRPTFRKSA